MPQITLKVTHTHAGVAYPPGHFLDVDTHTTHWLIDHQIGEPASHRPEPAPDAPDALVKTAKPPKE